MHVTLLPESVNSSDSLLKPHRVPWQVIVDHVIAKLQVNSLTACFSCNKDLDFSAEKILHPVFFSTFKSASKRHRTDAVLLKKPLQINLGCAVFCKNDDLIVDLFDQVNNLKRFRVLCHLIDAIYQN